MTGWTPLLIPMLLTLAWLWIPGLGIALALRVRPVLAWALAPLLSVAVIGCAALLAPMLGLPWGPIPPALLTLLLWGMLWGARLLLPRLAARRAVAASPDPAAAANSSTPAVEGADAASDPGSTRAPDTAGGGRARRLLRALIGLDGLTALAYALSAGLMGLTMKRILLAPDAISQTFDDIFHLNAVRWALEHSDASSMTLMSMTTGPDEAVGFYPAAWHGIVSLVMTSGGGDSIPVATNALTVVVCAFIWTAGGVALVRTILPATLSRIGVLPAGVLVTTLSPFPYMFLSFGVLYPNLLGTAMLPATLLLVLRFVGLTRASGLTRTATIIGGLLASISLSLAHPNTSMTLIALVIPIGVAGMIRALARWRRRRGTWIAPLVLTVFAVGVCLMAQSVWPIVRPPEQNLTWHPLMSLTQSIGEALVLGPIYMWPAWILMVLLAAGLYASIRRRLFALPAMWLVIVYLWCAAAAWPFGEARTNLVGVWYNDPFRLAALLAVPSLPLLALGAAHLLHAAARAIPRLHARRQAWAVGVFGAAALLLLTQQTGWMRHAIDSTASSFYKTDSSPLLTLDEARLLDELPELVPADAVVATDPWNGSALAYALSDVRTTNRHTLAYVSPAENTINQHLDEAEDNPAVCSAVQELGVDYALDFGEQQINDSDKPMDGFDDLDEAPGFELVAREGDARLYRVVACGA